MAERQWTDEQLRAIQTRDRTLLVSAAAGSGKTATLTERIIRSLTDKDSPAEISELLVVTFTKAAAAELRAKIARALEEAVAKNPENDRLVRQLYLLPSAKIRTIDSFCNDILRQNTDRVGISANYRIADAAEIAILSSAILDGLINSVYEGLEPDIATPEELEELAECLTSAKRSDELAEVLHLVWSKCECCESGIEALLPLIEYYNPDKLVSVEKTHHGAYIIEKTRECLEHYANSIKKYSDIFSNGCAAENKYYGMTVSDGESLSRVLCHSDYTSVRDAMHQISYVKCPTVSNADKTADMYEYLTLRKMMKGDIDKLSEFYNYTEDDWRELFATLYRLFGVLYRFERRFDEVFLQEKLRRGALDYSDIERFCYNLLIKDGKRTDIAENLSNQFSAIYIDEYQDVNSLQNKIFESLSRPDNRFMVGDIKQSIYGFRSARPEIFANMKRSFPPLSSDKQTAASVFMSKNFRCDRAVVDFVNSIFDKTFALIGDSIGYLSGDRLEYAKIHEGGEPPYLTPGIYMLDKDSPISEPDAVAMKIKELVDTGTLDDGSPIRPSDIAIILRYASNKYSVYAEALSKVGVPSEISGAKDFFLSAEVLLVLCLLNSIDNPRRDIYLAGLACSPLFMFNADDLYRIRREGEGESLYEALCSYTSKHTDFEKGKHFISELSHYRAIAEGVSVDTLLYRLYYETGLMALAGAGGGKENLTLLYDYARTFESGAFRGLYNFITFINNLIDKSSTFDENRGGDGSDAVKIVTCHASKGLEYPVVFLCECGSRFSDKDSRAALAFEEDFGISMRTRTPSGLALVESPVQDAVNYYVKKKNYDEELRVLYVALTRAREQLYVTGTCPVAKREDYEEKIATLRANLSPYSMRTLSSALEVMLVTCDNPRPHTLDELLGEKSTSVNVSAEDELDDAVRCETKYDEQMCDGELCDELYRRFTYSYPYADMTTLPEKLSVSHVYPTVLDDNEEMIPLFESEDGGKLPVLPRFAGGGASEESAKRGIATHLFMQFCDLENLGKVGANEELSRLVREGFISPDDSKRVRIREIEAFVRSELFAEMQNAAHIWREFRFNTELDARLFTTSESKLASYEGKRVLVQGVIDCIVEFDDGSIGLFDYKTDRLSKEELQDKELARQRMYEKHSQQLYYYSLAIERIFGRLPSRVEVYSLALGECLDVKKA